LAKLTCNCWKAGNKKTPVVYRRLMRIFMEDALSTFVTSSD